jgi:hypothetical protein
MCIGPTYPVLALAHDSTIIPYESETELASCNATGFWRNRYYEGLKVYDSDARAWRVVDASVARPRGNVARAIARIFNGRLIVVVKWERDSDLDGMDEARKDAEAWLRRDTDFWESEADMEEWSRRIRSCQTMPSLLSIFR